MKRFQILLIVTLIVTNLACGTSSEKMEEVKEVNTSNAVDSSTHNHAVETTNTDMHEVTVKEVLQAERYTYLKVTEKGAEYWIATLKIGNAKVGEQYLYQGGLLKTNFESQEHHRTFDKIYLVSEIINAKSHPGNLAVQNPSGHNHPIDQPVIDVHAISGATKISEILKNAKKYEGKVVTVTGEIVKANYGIMNSNWYHLQDGSKLNSQKADLVITSKIELQQGISAGFKGKVVLNKDLGSGYFFKVMIENAQLP